MNEFFVIPKQLNPPDDQIIELVNDFLDKFKPYEIQFETKLVLYFDKKSGAYYFICHLDGKTLASKSDLEASLDNNDNEDEIYKLNRDITEDKAAYKLMLQDAKEGRSFEDLVIEYDSSYHNDKPLKVYGGQHRIKAIKDALNNNGSSLHGIRIYFNLSREQKIEIATISNTSITVPNDLLDRMREQLLGSELRDWCQEVKLLNFNEDFADRRSHTLPTVRIARTLLVNYYKGLNSSDDEFHQPVICKSGGLDEDYYKIRNEVEWSNKSLLEMGKQFALLHKTQRDTVTGRKNDKNAEFARKAFSLTVVASWAYAVGLYQKNLKYLETIYSLPHTVSPPKDPLNAKALSEARLKGTDPDTYRGLGNRSSSTELGRMLEVFIVFTEKATQKKIPITKKLANAAIRSYEAKNYTYKAKKALEGL